MMMTMTTVNNNETHMDAYEFTSHYQFYYNIIKFKFNLNEIIKYTSAETVLFSFNIWFGVSSCPNVDTI